MEYLSSEFWKNRYINGNTGWDLGDVSPPLKAYIDQIEDKDIKILIPGCGNAYEGSYLLSKGFSNFYLLDFADVALDRFRNHHPDFPKDHLFVGDFFEHKGQYDLILEQTMFCAIDPVLRESYARHSSELLSKGGKLVGVMFDREFEGGPPYGGSKQEYQDLFKKYFTNVQIEDCYNSAAPRLGSEVFVILTK